LPLTRIDSQPTCQILQFFQRQHSNSGRQIFRHLAHYNLNTKPLYRSSTSLSLTTLRLLQPYWRRVNEEQVRQVLHAHSEGCSLRGISRLTKLAYGTVVSIVRDASDRAQLVHNSQVSQVQTAEVSADEMWSFVQKNRSIASQKNLELGDCWMAISLADDSGLILAARVGKHTDELISELIVSTAGKTDCKNFNSDDWSTASETK
jgi:hypothetical protein